MKPGWLPALGLLFLICANLETTSAQQTKKPFTVADDIGLEHFGGYTPFPEDEVQASPDGNYFAVNTMRGQLGLNRVESSLRFYRSEDIQDFLNHSGTSPLPSAVWIVNRYAKEGPVIECEGSSACWRWLPDSSGVAFLERVGHAYDHRLLLADLKKRKIEALTSENETVEKFDIRDQQHYVYISSDQIENEKTPLGKTKPSATVGTGRNLGDLLFSRSDTPHHRMFWAVVGGKRFEVKINGAPFVPRRAFALSPDGQTLITELEVPEVPESWEMLYPPPYKSSIDNKIHAGSRSVLQYVQVNLQSGLVRTLTDAPTSRSAGWNSADGSPSWSSDGQEILLPGTFLKSKENAPSWPCVAVVNLQSDTRMCVERLKRRTGPGVDEVEKDYHLDESAKFADNDKARVIVKFMDYPDGSFQSIEYRRTAGDPWQVVGPSREVAAVGRDGLEVGVQQGIDEPPVLVAKSKQTSQVIWNPNPQLKDLELGEASVYRWKDNQGKEREGGLYKPANYVPGHRYPLVIQTHGFPRSSFIPSGLYPSSNAARELAAAGIMVLQTGAVADCAYLTPDEGPCNALGYQTAAKRLVSDGLVDEEKIGIIGFSHTCFDVMEMLTAGSHHLRAATIEDGVVGGYLEFILYGVDDEVAEEQNALVGAPPFGNGMQQWLRRSPGFNLDKVTAPLLIVTHGSGVLSMWEPYAGLRYLKKPVELVMLNMENGRGTLPYEHELTNPGFRMASQGGSVDWFRFWFQDYEDPDPAKKEQYERWSGLKKMQEENDAKEKAAH